MHVPGPTCLQPLLSCASEDRHAYGHRSDCRSFAPPLIVNSFNASAHVLSEAAGGEVMPSGSMHKVVIHKAGSSTSLGLKPVPKPGSQQALSALRRQA
jgi:hypothetical protein